ncbi:MAG: Ig-like domain-containing protein [Vicinamibacteria bacterium]|nr:Ig-like domain-containing protein [Vicinamibacteria bacterium]
MIRRVYESVAARVAAGSLVAMVLASCGQAILSAPDGTTLQIFVNPPFIAANGDTAVVSVLAVEKAGTPVPDGTVIQFFTTVGIIDEQARTNDGVARVNLRSNATSGTAVVTAVSGAVSIKSDSIPIGARRVNSVKTQAVDQIIDLRLGKSTAEIGARVLDENGNPIPGIIVRFRVSSDPATDRLLEGSDVPTNNNGDAINKVQTKRTTTGTITIKVEVLAPGSVTAADITVQVVAGS